VEVGQECFVVDVGASGGNEAGGGESKPQEAAPAKQEAPKQEPKQEPKQAEAPKQPPPAQKPAEQPKQQPKAAPPTPPPSDVSSQVTCAEQMHKWSHLELSCMCKRMVHGDSNAMNCATHAGYGCQQPWSEY
jgi:hypothetical protein